MATKKANTKATTKSSPRRTNGAQKTSVKRVSTKAVSAKVTPLRSEEVASPFPNNLPNIIVAELVGTFILTVVALTTSTLAPLVVGLTVTALVLAVGVVSGAHLNPAVTFGVFAMRKLKAALVPVYWAAQFLGALLAVGVFSIVTSGGFSLSFAHFNSFNGLVMTAELVGMAAFMFGVGAVINRPELSLGGRALGIGLSLTVGLVAAGSLLYQQQMADYTKYQKSATETVASDSEAAFPSSLSVKGAVLNPAVAIAVTEDTSVKAQVTGKQAAEGEKAPNRLGWEVILGTFIGAAVGGNLYLLAAYRPREER